MSNSGFKPLKFNDFVKLNRGFDLPDAQIVKGDFPVVASTSIKAWHKAYKVKGPAVVTGRSGSLGFVQYVKGDCWPLNTALYVKDFKRNDPKFVYYFLKCMRLENFNSGAGVPTLNQNHLHKLPILVPELKVQQQIAFILSAYDDLIENNNRRIATLEKTIEEIYREWFVRMRFCGYENVKSIKGVPQSWRVCKLIELVKTQYGYTASALDEPVGPKFLRITDIVPPTIDWASVPYCKIEESEMQKYLVSEGDILVARTGATVGYAKRIGKRHPDSVFASYLVRLTPIDPVDSVYLGLSIERQHFKDFIQMFVTGAAQPQANATTMGLFPILRPPSDILKRFNAIVAPILDEKEVCIEACALLTRTRDLILPRLISGRLSINELKIPSAENLGELKIGGTLRESVHA